VKNNLHARELSSFTNAKQKSSLLSYSIAEDDNKYPTVGTIPKSNIKIVERGKMYTPTTTNT
jgi:hypothetical protein